MDYLTSTTAMEQLQLPASLVVIGGGFVGMEQAQLFAHLGTRVTVVGRLAPRAEPELAAALRGVFADDGITVLTEHATTVRAAPGGGVEVITASGQCVRGQRLLVATGRRARTDGLDLGAAGVKTDERGFVQVDQQQRTANPRVYERCWTFPQGRGGQSTPLPASGGTRFGGPWATEREPLRTANR